MSTQSLVFARWKELSSGTLNRRILSAAVTVGVLTLGVKVLGMLKEMLVASWFGTGDALDAFLAAFILPCFAINVIAGSMNAALIPVFVEVREKEGSNAAQRLFSGTLVFSAALLGAVTLLLALLEPYLLPLLCSGFAPNKLKLTSDLFYLLLPGILLTGLTMNCEAALNAGERFALSALAPGLVPTVIIATLAAAGSIWGIHALAYGLVAGFVAHFAVIAYALRKRELNLVPRWYGFEPGLRRVIKQYLPATGSAAIMCSTLLVDQSMASALAPGSVAALNFGNKIVALVLTIGTMALGTAVLPYFSRMVAAGEWSSLRATLRTYTRLILISTIPLTIIAIVWSRPLTAMLYERGQFGTEETGLVAWIQSMFLLQVPFYTLTILFVRMISSLQANHALLWGTVLSFVINISLNFVLMRTMGVAGIALSTSIVYAVLALFLGTVLWRKLRAMTADRYVCELRL